MNGRKQQLLKRHRRNKRIVMLVALLALLALGVLVAWWLPPLLLVLGWVAHEAWFADHLFYSPRDDYRYDFSDDCLSLPARIEQGALQVEADLDGYDTLVLELCLTATWLGRWLDPHVWLGDDRQDFERAWQGVAISICPVCRPTVCASCRVFAASMASCACMPCAIPILPRSAC